MYALFNLQPQFMQCAGIFLMDPRIELPGNESMGKSSEGYLLIGGQVSERFSHGTSGRTTEVTLPDSVAQ